MAAAEGAETFSVILINTRPLPDSQVVSTNTSYFTNYIMHILCRKSFDRSRRPSVTNMLRRRVMQHYYVELAIDDGSPHKMCIRDRCSGVNNQFVPRR